MNDTAHIGLNNVHNRLKILFGEGSYVKISSNEPEPGTSVWLVFNSEMQIHKLKDDLLDN